MMDKRYLETMGNRYMKNSFLTEEPEVFTYEPKRIPIGRDAIGNIFYLEFEDAIRALIVGMAGSGKTYFLRGMIDRLKQCPVEWIDENKKRRYDVGYSIFFPVDVKDELKSSKNPVQSKFRKGLLEGEEPKALKVITLRNTFFKEFRSELPDDNLWMSINLSDMQKRDFMTLLKAEQMTEAQQTMIEVLYDTLKKKPEFKLSDIPEMIDQLGADFKPSQLQAMKNKFKPLLTSQFGDPKYIRNLKKVMDKDYVLSLNMENYDYFGKGGVDYPSVVIGMTLRNLIHMRRESQIKPMWVFVDEAARFVPDNANPSCKHDFLESIDVDRRFNISYIFATQYIKDMPEKLVMQSRYMFIPFNADTSIIKEALIATGLVTRGFIQNSQNDANRYKRLMGKWQWLVLDRNKNRCDIITPLAPLSEHMETK